MDNIIDKLNSSNNTIEELNSIDNKYEIKLTVTDLETKKHCSVTMKSNLLEDVKKLSGNSLLDEMYNAVVQELEQLKKEILRNE